MIRTFPAFLLCSSAFLQSIQTRVHTGPTTGTSTVSQNHADPQDPGPGSDPDLRETGLESQICLSRPPRSQPLPADGPQEPDVQTAAAAGQTLCDGAAEHLGSERPAGLPVCSLRPRPQDTWTPPRLLPADPADSASFLCLSFTLKRLICLNPSIKPVPTPGPGLVSVLLRPNVSDPDQVLVLVISDTFCRKAFIVESQKLSENARYDRLVNTSTWLLLPPTVSTCRHKHTCVSPPPRTPVPPRAAFRDSPGARSCCCSSAAR